MDKQAEKFVNTSPYSYCLDNPLNLIDPDGEGPKPDLSKIWNVENVLKGKSWVNYQDIGNCNESARKQNSLSGKAKSTPVGANQTINMFLDNKRQKESGKETSGINLQKGVDVIIKNLNDGKPVMVGVMYERNVGADHIPGGTSGDNTNVATNHYVNIVGMGIDEKGNSYFSYYDNYVDPGKTFDSQGNMTSYKTNVEMEKEGTNLKLNRFYLKKDSKGNYYFADPEPTTILGPAHSQYGVNLDYILTEIRDNN